MAKPFTEIARRGRLYVGGVIVCGALVIAYSVESLVREPVGWNWLVLAVLTVFTGSFSIKIPSVSARLSVSEAFVFAAVLLFGLPVATLIVALDSLILSSWLRRDNRSSFRVMFNMAAGAVAISSAATVLQWMVTAVPAATAPLEELVVPVLLLAVIYFLINSWLIAFAVAFERTVSAIDVWRKNFLWFGLNYLGGASAALVLVSFTKNVNIAAVGVVVPLVLILYVTFRTSWGRVEDANRHVAQVNELYLSTIEALAMAVDAKDQITHGHIRRVQVYAIELARRLGVDNDQQLKAIATAALLHDMGKLAIPEHILNKPGKLTPAEFDKMKRHSDIGADLLSSVKFPYPVVPIVRHHHERWDGSGYPAGLAGTDIPFGARVLSVVDCFDALTSDRPYRPRLTSDEAFAIIQQERAKTYDPLVVDTFMRTYSEISPAAIRAGEEAKGIIDLGREDDVAPLSHIRANASEAAVLGAFGVEISKSATLATALQATAQTLRQLTPVSACALFVYDSDKDVLSSRSLWGDEQKFLDGLTIKPGERITGWVAANRRSSLNSQASLDLARIADFFSPPLRSTISTPLIDGERLIGVLSGYAARDRAFDEGHQYTFEQVASFLAAKMSNSAIPGNVVSFARRQS